ncbi:MAG: TRAP transporter small permease [Sediminispirochaetaceae bacterium]
MRKNTIFDRIFDILEWLITSFLVFIFVLTVTMVVLRYVFRSSILGGSELITFLFIYTTAIGAAVAIPRNRHIRIDFFINQLSGWMRAASEVLVYLCIAGINAVMMLYSLDWIAKVGKDLSQSLGIPLGWVKISVPIGCSLAVLFSLYAVFMVIRTGGPLKEENCL